MGGGQDYPYSLLLGGVVTRGYIKLIGRVTLRLLLYGPHRENVTLFRYLETATDARGILGLIDVSVFRAL